MRRVRVGLFGTAVNLKSVSYISVWTAVVFCDIQDAVCINVVPAALPYSCMASLQKGSPVHLSVFWPLQQISVLIYEHMYVLYAS